MHTAKKAPYIARGLTRECNFYTFTQLGLVKRGRKLGQHPLIVCMASHNYLSKLLNFAESLKRARGAAALVGLGVWLGVWLGLGLD